MALRLSSAFLGLGAFITLFLFLALRPSWQPAMIQDRLNGYTQQKSSSRLDTRSELGRAGNGTLGFEKITVLGLKERFDRRDALALQSSLSGFHVEWIDGVKGADVPEFALPPGMVKKEMVESYVGSWRGHMNAIRSIIDDQRSSVLIMEDDVDWDIRILSQMQDLAKGVRHLSNIPLNKHQKSPYGDDWDVIWPGHCGEVLPERDDRRYIIKDDETVAPKAHQPWLKALKDHPEKTRLIHKTGAPLCTFAYAVSARGAQKILAGLALKGISLSFDNVLAYFCKDEALNIKCFTVQPMLFYHHRSAGSLSKDSDNAGTIEGSRERGFTDNIVISTRLNVEKLLTGATDYVMQW